MPSPYSSLSSVQDAQELATRLGIRTAIIPIDDLLKSFHQTLNTVFSTQGIVEENLQARLRGTILMAYSNAHPSLLLTTGNKSELAVGYCTLYGDMNGAFNPIGDVYKTDVFALCHYLNKQTSCFPENILTKAPSAELRANQKDEDSLPPYPILDALLKELIEGQSSYRLASEKTGQSYDLASHIARLVSQAEFKRFQSPPLLKVTALAFGSGRRMPLAACNFDLNCEKD
ncbi:UNVERIFIED_CONTAM: hypothetical protein PYX00_011928 [Menopon gallinae]|uniref:NAD/GMP synthase domain-containing protein n=1 Tax=Menopon gallinae TaxID=328185 RepID=A0AAW2H8W5_9NEOP